LVINQKLLNVLFGNVEGNQKEGIIMEFKKRLQLNYSEKSLIIPLKYLEL
jgi:hypothetical protein